MARCRGARFAAEEEGIYKVPGAAAKRMQQLGDSIIKLQKGEGGGVRRKAGVVGGSPLRNTIPFPEPIEAAAPARRRVRVGEGRDVCRERVTRK